MVRPAPRAALPHQPTREALELQRAMEDDRRRRAATGGSWLMAYARPADAAASDTSDEVIHYADRALVITSAVWVSSGDVSADATNYATVTLSRFSPSASSPIGRTVGSLSTAEQGLVRGLPRSLGLAASVAIAAGQALAVVVSKPGTGVSLAAGRLLLRVDEAP